MRLPAGAVPDPYPLDRGRVLHRLARVITSFGPLVAGLMVGAFGGSFNKVTAFMT